MNRPEEPAVSLEVLAPVAGTVLAMADVPDPVFAEALVGPGIAVDPVREGDVLVVAPVAGTLVKLHPHAFVILATGGRGVLVHMGLDTVELRGEGFTLHAAEKDTVDAGQVLVTWRPAEVAAGGRSPVCPVVALDAAATDLALRGSAGDAVDVGDPLFTWA